MQNPALSLRWNGVSPAILYSGLAALGLVLLYLLQAVPGLDLAPQHSAYLVLGATGAIFANSTGAGGGVVFIPMFHHLGFTEAQAVATSFGIQCFGMTTGAIAWSSYFRDRNHDAAHWQPLLPVLALCSAFSVAGLWTVFALQLESPATVASLFACFSLVLGAAVLGTCRWDRAGKQRVRLAGPDLMWLPLIAYFGGMITAWLSVGVGELLAFYLILRRYDPIKSVAVAVIVSAISVWAATPEQLFFNQQVNWQIIVFAGPGAIAGGLIARKLVLRLGTKRLKLFFGAWLLLIGLAEFVPLG